MALPVFIGDEVTAAGYRLAGVDTRVREPAEAGEAVRQARDDGAPLILITAECAEGVQSEWLFSLIASMSPPTLIVADADGRVPVPDIAERIRRKVGLS